MTKEELSELFKKYLYRDITKEDIKYHLAKNYKDFEIEISNCEERKNIEKNFNNINGRIAILLCGHIRRNTILKSIINFSEKYNIDVFVFTWDNVGIKGSETNLDDAVNLDLIQTEIKKLPNVVKYKIENNKEYIQKHINDDNTYFNFSSPEIFLKSQLYSINECYNLLKNHIEKTQTKYSMVMKCRFDLEFIQMFLNEKMIDDINEHNIIFTPNKDLNHDHPDYGTSCWACDNMYYKHKLKNVHIFEHTNIICDTFAYGSLSSMEKYCTLYNDFDTINKSFIDQNLESIEKNNLQIKKIGDVYKINNLDSLYYVNCSYPERLLQKHLKNYMLVESKLIKMKFKR